MPSPQEQPNEVTAESLIADLQRLEACRCPDCAAVLCHHQVLFSIAMGFKNSPRCLPCLAGVLKSDVAGLRESLFGYIRRRDCFQDAWVWASHEEQTDPKSVPDCVPSGAAL